MKKIKFIIDGEKVRDLKGWCNRKGLNYNSLKSRICSAKNKGKKEAVFWGSKILRVR